MAYLGHERAVVATLEGAAAVTNVVATRIYPSHAAQGAMKPYLVYEEIDADHFENFTASSGVATSVLEIRGFSRSKSELLILREAVRATLQRLTPGVVTVSGDTINLRGISIVGQRDEDQDPRDGSDATVFGFSQDYAVHYFE